MKINDVINCVNKALESERIDKRIEAKGHFVFHIYYEKLMGAVKKFHATIEYIRYGVGDKGVPKRVMYFTHTENCPTDKIEEVKEKLTLTVLEEFFYLLRSGINELDYDNFVKGTFNGIE